MSEITSQQLHICASVLLDAQGRGAGGGFTDGEQALLQGAHFLSELASKPDTVTVPRELLQEVLIVADHANNTLEKMGQKMNTSTEGFLMQRARIAELRKATGMEEERD